jgi:hypothetical protein
VQRAPRRAADGRPQQAVDGRTPRRAADRRTPRRALRCRGVHVLTPWTVLGAHGHGPHPTTNGEWILLSAWLKQGRDGITLQRRVDLVLVFQIFFPEFENNFEGAFSRVEVALRSLRRFCLAISKNRTQNNFLISERKSIRLNRPFPAIFFFVLKRLEKF